jgi:nucleobase transporter 1/2
MRMTRRMIYEIDDVPPLREAVGLGFQHYLTMFGSTVAIPLLLAERLGMKDDAVALGWLIGTMFFVSGITTLLQTTWGNRLPLVQGGTFSFLAPAFAIIGMAALSDAGWEVRLRHVQGAVIGGSLFEIVIGYTGLVGRILRFVGPITIAPTIALIGLALFKFGAPVAGTHWGIGGLTIVLIILFSQYMRRTHRAFELFPIMLGILLAWGVAALLTLVGVFEAGNPARVSLDNVATAAWFRIPYPFQWGWPVFGAAAVVGMLAGYLASIVESVGDYYACARLAGAPVPKPSIINRGIGMEGVGCLLAGIFGTGNGTTSYSENIGAIGLTRVGSRRVVQLGALIMMILAAFGKFGALFTTIPQPVVGGMYCAMFGMIASVGLSNLQFVDLNSARNLFIVGFALFMGLSVPEYFAARPVSFEPEWVAGVVNTLGSTGMAVGAICALVLDNTIPGTAEERGLTAWMQTEETTG